MIQQLFMVAWKPLAVCLVTGALRVLYDYQVSPHWTPALVDGSISALTVLAAFLGINGAAAGARTAAGAPPGGRQQQ